MYIGGVNSTTVVEALTPDAIRMFIVDTYVQMRLVPTSYSSHSEDVDCIPL